MSKVNILLDLDQTLISAEKPKEYEKYREDILKTVDVNKYPFLKDVKNMDNYYQIVSRPGLQEFLTFLFDSFNVGIQTASSKDYCLFVTEHIVLNGNSNRKLDYILFNYHGFASEKIKNSPKAMSMFWDEYKLPGYNKDNTVILDDYDEVYKPQKENCIFIPEFKFSDPNCVNDNYLITLKEQLIKLRDEYKSGNKIGPIVDSINKSFKREEGNEGGGKKKSKRGRKKE